MNGKNTKKIISKFQSIVAVILLLGIGFIGLMPLPVGAAEVTKFVVMGDLPYMAPERRILNGPNGKLFKAIRAVNPPVLIHYGDFKSGAEACTDERLQNRKSQMAHLNPSRVVYTPGDNDWTDCDRFSFSGRFSEIERLEFIRNLFFKGTGLEMSKGIPGLVRQKGQAENARWTLNGLAMGTLHLVGTNNGRTEILKDDEEEVLNAVDQRDIANLEWLQTIFEAGQAAQGVVIVFQADIYREPKHSSKCTPKNRNRCDGLQGFRESIATLATQYKKPVLVVHGDTSDYCLDQPVSQAPNLWHLNGPGDFKISDAAEVTFDPNNKAKPFDVKGVLTSAVPSNTCDTR